MVREIRTLPIFYDPKVIEGTTWESTEALVEWITTRCDACEYGEVKLLSLHPFDWLIRCSRPQQKCPKPFDWSHLNKE